VKTVVQILLVLFLFGAVLLAAGASPTAEQPQAATGPIEMRYTSWYTGESEELERPIIDWWNEANPDKNMTFLPIPWGTYKEKLFTMIAGGDAPDVAAIDTWWSQQFYEKGATVPLQSFIDRDGIDVSIFRQGFLDEGISALDGKLYGLPWGPGRNILFYQNELFAKLGLPEPKYGWTTDDFIAAGKKTTQDTNNDGVMDMWGTTRYWPPNAIAIFGAEYVDARTGKQKITSPEFIAALQFIVDLTEKHRVQPSAAEQSSLVGGGRPYLSARFGTWQRFDGHVGWSIKAGLPEKISYRVTYAPTVPGQPPTTFQKGNSICLMSGSKHQEEAWEFIRFYISPKVQNHWADVGSYPATKAAAARETFRHPAGYEVIDLEPSIKPAERIVRLPFDVPGWVEAYNDVIAPKIEAAVLGEMTAEEAMGSIAAEVDQILADARKKATK
jgi:multiple sugar transport system substrate-binding protein